MRIYANIKLNIDAHSHPFVSIQWTRADSNRLPLQCKCSVLPAELRALIICEFTRILFLFLTIRSYSHVNIRTK